MAAGLLLVGGGVFVTRAVTGASGGTGAASPAAAVTNLVNAVQKKDPAGLFDAIDPVEVRGLAAAVRTVQSKANKAGIGSGSGGNTSANDCTGPCEFSGINVRLDHVRTTTEHKSDRVAEVVLDAGTASVSIDRSKLSSVFRSLIPDEYGGGSYPVATQRDQQDFTMALYTVRIGGGWYVSPAYTIGEALMERNGIRGTFSNSVASAATASSPRNAAQAFVSALGRGSDSGLDRALAMVEPQERTILEDLSPLWRGDADATSFGYRAVAAATANDAHATIHLDKTTTTNLDGGQTGVVIERAHGTWQSGSTSGSYTVDGNRFSYRDFDGGSATLTGANDLWEATAYRVGGSLASGNMTVSTVKSGNGYAVSLVGTAVATAMGSIGPMDANTFLLVLWRLGDSQLDTSWLSDMKATAALHAGGSTTIKLPLREGKYHDAMTTVRIERAGDYRIETATLSSGGFYPVYGPDGRWIEPKWDSKDRAYYRFPAGTSKVLVMGGPQSRIKVTVSAHRS